MWKVTNKADDVRKFRDNKLGKDVLVEPGESILTNNPPEENNIWKVDSIEEKSEKKKSKKEVEKNDSSSDQ